MSICPRFDILRGEKYFFVSSQVNIFLRQSLRLTDTVLMTLILSENLSRSLKYQYCEKDMEMHVRKSLKMCYLQLLFLKFSHLQMVTLTKSTLIWKNSHSKILLLLYNSKENLKKLVQIYEVFPWTAGYTNNSVSFIYL